MSSRSKTIVLEYNLQLRQEHINYDIQKHPCFCAVALFLTEAKEMPIRVTKEGAWESLPNSPFFGKKIASFGKGLRKFIRTFDKDKSLAFPQRISVRVGPHGGTFMDII